MKKTISFLFVFFLLQLSGYSQSASPEAVTTVSEKAVATADAENFDNTWRFGLRVTPQFCWFTKADKNVIPSGALFGYGFGLQVEYRFSETVGLVSGIGGDFEGGNYTSTYDTANSYAVRYWVNNEGELLQPQNGTSVSDLRKQNNTEYVLNERKITTSYLTIPAILKLSTKEIGGFKYFGMFGGEIGIRLKTKAEDSYHSSFQYDANGVAKNAGISSQSDIDLSKDTPLIPMRVGLNVGIGTEYRLAGNTSFLFSANFFRSFVNVLKSKSEYLVSNVEPNGTVNNYAFIKQGFLMSAVRINLGILF